MLARIFTRSGFVATAVAVIAVSCLASSCGGGGIAAKDMILVELQFLDRGLQATAPTGTQSLPRNAIVGMIFSELVNPASVTNQTVQIRFGGSFQSVPPGSFNVNGNQVLFDPTVTAQGQPNPLGFQPVTQYVLDIPGVGEQETVLTNLDGDPNLTTFFTQFTTASGWLRELVPPEVLEVIWIPEEDPLTKQIPGNGIMGVRFNEAMDPATFVPSVNDAGPDPSTGDTIDVRYTLDSINDSASGGSVAGKPLPGSFSPSADFQTFFFKPMFSFGDKKFVFTLQAFQGLTDLSGNLLVNPRSFGPFTCDGLGIETGLTYPETFIDTVNKDVGASDADWGDTEEGTLQGLPVTSRNAYAFSYVETDDGSASGRGQYAPVADPLIGEDILQIAPGLTPPPSQGRRVMYSFSDTLIGAKGSVTAVAWGPDSNATFAGLYENIRLRMGYQKANSRSLSPSFSGNYEGQPTIIYSGDYQVQQNANVGDTPGHPASPHVGGYQVNGPPWGFCTPNWNAPLFFTGFYPYPDLTTFFEWDPGDLAIENDRVLLFDASAPAGDTYQLLRLWFGVTFPCSGVLIGGLPLTRLYATYEEDDPNPADNPVAGVQNPEQSVTDTCFTITRRVSIGQSQFFGPGFGNNTDYRDPVITPTVQPGGAQIVVEFQGADAFEPDGASWRPSAAAPSTGWVQDIDDCDGRIYIRWRVSLISNLISLETSRVYSIIIPYVSSGP